MKKPVMLSIEGRQYYDGQDPEVIELITEGTMEFARGGWDISYQETELTGMAGVTTTLRIEPGTVILRRCGKLRSEMVFREGIGHQSLYQMEFGTMLLTVCARQIAARIGDHGGEVDLVYDVEIEHCAAGMVEYHLDIRMKE